MKELRTLYNGGKLERAYLSYDRYMDNFTNIESRFYWYFKYLLVSIIKVKLKCRSCYKVFYKSGFDIICCLDSKGNETYFIK